MKKLFVGGLPTSANEESVRQLFTEYGTVRSIEIITDLFSGNCRGFGFVEMEGHEARAAIAGLNGQAMGDGFLKIRYHEENKRGKKRGRR